MSKQQKAQPRIYPINLGRDGWTIIYDTPFKRLMFLCGLRLVVAYRGKPSWRIEPGHLIKGTYTKP